MDRAGQEGPGGENAASAASQYGGRSERVERIVEEEERRVGGARLQECIGVIDAEEQRHRVKGSHNWGTNNSGNFEIAGSGSWELIVPSPQGLDASWLLYNQDRGHGWLK